MSTKTASQPTAPPFSLFVFALLGVSVLWVGPIGCDGGPEEQASQTNEKSTERSILLNIGIENDTDRRPLASGFLIETPSGAHWAPDVPEGEGVTKAFEKHSVGKTRTLRIYPKGEGGRSLEVPITMKHDMSSLLASSRTDIFVYDDSIVVSGPAVPDSRVTFDRLASTSP